MQLGHLGAENVGCAAGVSDERLEQAGLSGTGVEELGGGTAARPSAPHGRVSGSTF
ncbi:hypothetical protein GCM10011578_062170 [Streptomyces fuscichromogenes]|uniref:Uncharacterized protein n=1 Tax=Streptomyces fuscichromogenes TaxID=1324013 RepID=A0A917XHX0_9ACTN|nr:hypothetical protein GCM10011578_062170 [Streptomyces fuscichromogenes]